MPAAFVFPKRLVGTVSVFVRQDKVYRAIVGAAPPRT